MVVMISEPLVTVGIPAYNRARYLREALDALLQQSHAHLEILVSDDASADETPKVCEEYARKDARVRCFRQSKTLGIAGNHNFLLHQASGKYFVWACDDDMRHTEFIKRLADLLSSYPDAVGAMCGVQHIIDGEPRVIEEPWLCSNNCSPYEYLLHYARTGDYRPIGGMFLTSALKTAGGYHGDSRPFFRASDYLTILKLALQGKVVYTSEALFFKRDTGNAHNAFEILGALRLDRGTLLRMLRYACFPLFYCYNLVFGVRFVAGSGLRCAQKARVVSRLFGYYVRSNLVFGWNVVRGLWALLTGFVRRLFALRPR